MSNKRNKEKIKDKLRRADSERSADVLSSSVNSSFIEKYTKARGNVSSVFSKKNKFPIGLDIFISVLLIVIVAALVVGAYFLIIKFDDAYDNATIEYTLLVPLEQTEGIQKGNNVYIDRSGSVVYIGSVIEVNRDVSVSNVNSAVTEYVTVTVRADALYRDDEGYNIDDEKIAVGRAISVRINNRALLCEIIGLSAVAANQK